MTQETGVQLIDNRLQAIADKLADLAEQYGPEVTDAMLAVTRLQGFEYLIYGVLFLIPSVIIGLFAWYKFLKSGIKNKDIDEIGTGLLLGTVSALGFIITGSFLFDIWTWVAIFEPKLAIARKLLEGVL